MAEPVEDTEETRQLLERIRAGDAHAVSTLLAAHQTDLRQFVALRLDTKLRARFDPSDVVQEAELEVFRRLQDYLQRRPMPFRLWLRKTAYERLLMLRRQHVETGRRTVEREQPLPDQSAIALAELFCASISTPSQQFSREELARLVTEALTQLADTDRSILLMRNVELLSYEEISCILSIEAAAARKRYGRALLRLRQVLQERGLLDLLP